MATTPKRRAVCSYENMSDELAAAFAEKYPKGYSDYFPDLVKYDKPDGTNFYAVTVEIPDAIYLVKIKVKTDDAEDIERWLEGDDGKIIRQVANKPVYTATLVKYADLICNKPNGQAKITGITEK